MDTPTPQTTETAETAETGQPVDTGEDCVPVDWYADGDGDGYGVGAPQSACEAPPGWSARGDDCDDADAAIHPDAAEICADGVDQDCDGIDLSCPFSGEIGLGELPKLYAPNAGDDAGRLLDVGDATGDGSPDLLVATWGADGYAGGGYLVPGPIPAGGALEALGHAFVGDRDTTYGAGRAIGVGDVDGDGIDDVGFGVPYATACGLYIFRGPIDAGGLVAEADIVVLGDVGTFAGHGADLADISGDGVADVVVGAYHTSVAAHSAGAVYIKYGPIGTTVDLVGQADVSLQGEGEEFYTGRHVQAGGDVDGDGVADILVVAPNGTGMAPTSGIVYVVYGPGDVGDMSGADGRLLGEMPGAYLGTGVAISTGDVNGDGFDDVAAGAYYDATAVAYGGAAYVVFGPIDGDVDLGAADVVVRGAVANQYAGSAVALGDADGDPRADFAVGAYGTDTSTGAVYLYYAPTAGSYALVDAEAVFRGEGITHFAGANTIFADVDGEVGPELLIGATGEPTGGSGAGAVYVAVR